MGEIRLRRYGEWGKTHFQQAKAQARRALAARGARRRAWLAAWVAEWLRSPGVARLTPLALRAWRYGAACHVPGRPPRNRARPERYIYPLALQDRVHKGTGVYRAARASRYTR